MNNKRAENKISALMPEIFISLAIDFLLFIYGSVECYYHNRNELYYSIHDILQYLFPVFCVFFLTFLGILLLMKVINEKIEFFFYLFSFSGFIILYIQGTFLSSTLPPLDGRKINWEEYKSENIISYLLIFTVIVTVILIYHLIGKKKFITIAKTVSVCLFFVLLLIFGFFFIQCYEEKEKEVYCTNEKILEMCDDKNLIIFLADQIDAEAFSEMMVIHPEYRDYFEDFTFFNNTMSGYPWTLRSIPFILSGQWFENEKSYWEYTPEAMSSSPLFTYLKDNNYKMCFYEPEFIFAVKDMPFENFAEKNEHFNYPEKFLKMQIKLSGYRYLPFFLKHFCFLSTEDFYIDTLKSDEYSSYSINNSDFENTIKYTDISITSEKCFKFIYILGAHTPFDYKAESVKVEDFSYESSIENSISVFMSYIRKLKDANVYDNTAIIFMADHGYAPEYQDGVGRQNPVFIVKGINEHHPFQISDVPISHADLINKYSELAEGAISTDVFSDKEDRPRRYLLFSYGEENLMYEYYQYGIASDEKTMKPTGKIYSR